MIIGCLAASAAIGAGNAIAEGEAPEFRQIAGFVFVGIGLGTAAMFAPGLAGSMAVLVLTSTVFLEAGPVLDAITATTTSKPAKKAGARTTKSTTTPAPDTTVRIWE